MSKDMCNLTFIAHSASPPLLSDFIISMDLTSWAQCYKTFYGRNLQILQIASVCSWQAFLA
jgi:hypothetical protein